MKNLILLIAILALSSCSAKITIVDICPEVDEGSQVDMYIDTSGASLTTRTDQTTDGKPSFDINLPFGSE
jgi:uncharacterized lipoprotein YajG